MDENMISPPPSADQPGKGYAIASLVLGIISIVFIFVFPIIGLIAGIVGVVSASMSKKRGYVGGLQTGGFVCSLIGLIINACFFVACVACAGMFGAAGTMGNMGR